ncbi:MAG TPA: PH domain-containing protein [Methanocella sp.]|uniref:PH domain-containing protein n=1 Tax=Methanocella sp. TaxID=2052833 RepID=UPI002C0C4F4F|nr:PH domain-containing protein [Methanocella sp.]HTY89963.1 PH domain-containing protein [Methanocella sp.]
MIQKVSTNFDSEETILWTGKPSGIRSSIKDKAQINATSYTVTSQRITIKSGLIGKKEEDIDLYRIKDIKVNQSLKDRAMGIGDIEIVLIDGTMKIMLEEVKDPNNVKETVRKAMIAEKTAQRTTHVQKEVVKEVVKIPCKYCGGLIESTSTKCPICGAPLNPFK